MVLNIAAYRFVPVADAHRLAEDVRQRAGSLDLRGTVLVAEEGINLFLAGAEPAVRGFLDFLGADARFAGMEVKESTSLVQPFARLKVKVKPEIISFRRDGASPLTARAPVVAAATLAVRQELSAGRPVDGSST